MIIFEMSLSIKPLKELAELHFRELKHEFYTLIQIK